MLRSLRFRLPALFLLGFLFAGLVSTAIAFRLFQNYTHDRALQDLRRESAGAVHLYEKEAGRASVSPLDIERATGDRLFYIPRVPGFTLLQPLDALPPSTIDMKQLERSGRVEFTLHRGAKTYLAVARPIEINGHLFGALVAAKQKEELQSQLTPLLKRLAVAFGFGLFVAALLSLYLSRRIVRPLRKLSRAADDVARGRYEVEVPEVPGRTEIAHLADRFRGMAERLAEAEELERNFLMTVSHELRTPLTAIQGHVAALREGVFDDEETRAFSLEVIDQEAARLGRLVGDVLDLAKLDAHRFTVLHEEVDMEQLVERAYAAFGEEARRRSIDYRQEIRARPVIVTDGDRVLQIISNLLSNAFRWTPEGGRVEVSLGSENGAVEVDISDTGPGITAEERERIFRPFWSRDGSGTGLGLAIARELAVALGGRIELDSKPGRGSRFRLVLPTSR
jgi:two-component system sensor histidine kinase BaeS